MKFKRYSVADRGFYGYEFTDLYDKECSIQESSLATDNAIWLGVNGNRMHLNIPLAAELMKYLITFIAEGGLPE